MIKIAIGVAALAVALGLNWAAYASAHVTDTAWARRDDALAWTLFERIERRDGAWVVPAELRALDGTPQRLVGALFPLPQLTQADGAALGAVLAPPAKYGCCALSCDPRPNLQVLVEFPTPQQVTEPQRCIAEGVLRLHLGDDGGWSLASLEGARITAIDAAIDATIDTTTAALPEAAGEEPEARSPMHQAESPISGVPTAVATRVARP